jgi:hypothetical protein
MPRLNAEGSTFLMDDPLLLRRRWFRWGGVANGLCGVALVLLGVFAVSFPYAYTYPDWQHALFVGFLSLGGAAMAYAGLTRVVNATVLEVEGGTLRTTHGPLPSVTITANLPVTSLRQVFVHPRPSRRSLISPQWEVHVRIHDGSTLVLADYLRSREEAEFIEWVVELHAGIEDDPRYDAPSWMT